MKARIRRKIRRKSKSSKELFFPGKEGDAAQEFNAVDSKIPMQAQVSIQGRVGGKEKEGKKVSKVLPKPASSRACDPKPLTHKKLVAKSGNKNDLGITEYALSPSQVKPSFKKRKGKWLLKKKSAKFKPLYSVYTEPGIFSKGEVAKSGGGSTGCPIKEYPIRYNLTKAGSREVAAGEKEHCSDFNLVHKQSVGKYVDIVNKFAKAKKEFKSKPEAMKSLELASGVHPGKWFSTAICLANKSLTRDTNNSHTANPKYRLPRKRSGCKFVTAEINAASFPHIGKHSSASIIKGCP